MKGLGKDRSGILLIAVGAILILGSMAYPVSGNAVDGTGASGQDAQSRLGKESGQEDKYAELVGSIQIAGSSSMESYVSALAEGFMESYPDITVTVQFTGSSAGIAAVTMGSADIGISSRYLKEEEKAAGIAEYVVGFDGIALCANSANGVSGITREELSGIYTGEIRNWQQLKGSDLPVVVVGREAGSGTRDAFEGWLHLEDQCAYANELDSTGAVMARILATPGAIGYVSFETVDRVRKSAAAETKGKGAKWEGKTEGEPELMSVLCLDGIVPSLENIGNGSYPLYRPFVMAVNGRGSFRGRKPFHGDGDSQNRLVSIWFDYVGSKEGQEIAEMTGLFLIP